MLYEYACCTLQPGREPWALLQQKGTETTAPPGTLKAVTRRI